MKYGQAVKKRFATSATVIHRQEWCGSFARIPSISNVRVKGSIVWRVIAERGPCPAEAGRDRADVHLWHRPDCVRTRFCTGREWIPTRKVSELAEDEVNPHPADHRGRGRGGRRLRKEISMNIKR